MAWTSVRRTVFMIRSTSLLPYLIVSNILQGVRNVVESNIDRPHWGLAKLYNSEILPSDKAYMDGTPNTDAPMHRHSSKQHFLLLGRESALR